MTFDELIADLDSDGFGHYFAGLADGEGSFGINERRNMYYCQFRLRLRDDDAPIIHEIYKRLGIGRVLAYPGETRYGRNSNPCIGLQVAAKSECATLVRVFERYPLRAKKRKDFDLWRRAVAEWCAKEPGDWDTMIALSAQLSAIREYVASDTPRPAAEVVDLQLRLLDRAA